MWDRLRGPYNFVVARCAVNGLERTMNGTDSIRVLPAFRGITESYEPQVWSQLMNMVRPGDTVADVGAFIGLYAVALARRVGPKGHIAAFEPDRSNFAALEEHCRLNGVKGWTDLMKVAVGEANELCAFAGGRGCESHRGSQGATEQVRCVTLDSVFSDRRLDLLKIDVEGYEEAVLQGAQGLLTDSQRRPRAIFIEVHPYAWSSTRTTATSLIRYLTSVDYMITDLEGRPVQTVERYGEIVARSRQARTH
jgi:FkbM family methyltransferase